MNWEENYKLEKREHFLTKVGMTIFFIMCLFLIWKLINYTELEQKDIEIGKYKCWNDTKVWSMYNGVKAEAFGITDEQMVNITYAYLYNYTIWTSGGIQDKFIEIPRKKCCYAIYIKGSEIGEWYCQEEISS